MRKRAPNLRIWVLQIGEPLPVTAVREMRTALLCRELAARGHDVVWWASAFDHFTKQWLFGADTRVNVAPHLDIVALHGCGYSSNLSLRRFVDHRLVARRFRRLSRKEPRPDLIVASLPSHDLAWEGARYGMRHDVPFVVDVRDPWPDWIVDHLPPVARAVSRVILSRDFAMVRYQMSHAAAVTSMMDSLLHWGQQRGGASRRTDDDKVFYLGARRMDPPARCPSPKLAFLNDLGDRRVFAFVGTFGRYYHPAIVADAARELQHEPVHFVLGGHGDFMDEVRQRSRGLTNVTLPGWLNDAEIAWLMSKSVAGIVPANIPTDAFPNKLFTYFAAGRPIISSLQGDLPALLERERIGLSFPPGDVAALISAIRVMLDDVPARDDMTGNAERFFARSLDAAIIYETFANHLEHVAAGFNSRKKGPS